ncbi:MAG: dihydropteroate synthase, partial [Armatimonadetes bacterium]|nr:dihydropteroate synthase [Armatimonadota bacterium]
MPLKEGREWSYLVHDDLGSRVMTVRAGETVRVGPASGRLLMGEGGDSRMAWSGGELLVSEFSAMRFDPAMAQTVAKAEVPVVLMHLRGRPKDMQAGKIVYEGGVVAAVKRGLKEALDTATEA